MNVEEQFKRESIIRAIQSFNFDYLNSEIKNGEDIKKILQDKNLIWDVQKNFLPEIENFEEFNDEEKEQLEEISQRLKNGNKIIKILFQTGAIIPGINQNYTQYSLYELEENRIEFEDDEDGISAYSQTSIINLERVENSLIKNLDSALWLATSPKSLKLMIENGADVNFKDNSGWTALHYIALAPKEKYFKPVETIKILLEEGANVNAQTENKITPLMLAIHGLEENIISSDYDDYYKNNIKIIALLVKHGADVKAQDKYNHDLDYWADIYGENRNIYKGFIEEIKNYHSLSNDEFDFIVAMFSGDFYAIQEIIEKNPDINLNFQTSSGYTPLMFALQNENNDLLGFILECGANPNLQNSRGEKALHYAIRTGCGTDKIELLLLYEADPNIKNSQGKTPLNIILRNSQWHNFISDRDLQIIRLLVEYGANPNIPDENGVTFLMQCVSLDNYYKYDGNIILAMKLLINHGADVNTRDNNGNTPLMYAAKYHADVIKNLLASGADPSMKNNDGESVIEILLNTFWGDSDNDNDDENILQRASLHFSPEDFITND
mgnify:CR=1 FL=1